MSNQLILYIGKDADQLTAQLPAEGQLLVPEDVMEALGMYVTMFPSVIVLDMVHAPDFAWEAYHHLRSVDAAPMVVIVCTPPLDNKIVALPADANAQDVLHAISDQLAIKLPT